MLLHIISKNNNICTDIFPQHFKNILYLYIWHFFNDDLFENYLKIFRLKKLGSK